MTIQKLFFQLIQVSLGQLDCLDRGPSPEEWQELFELSKSHQVAPVCYDGVVRLFDFGLRAPQDLSIDWMAETETDDGQQTFAVPEVSSKLRRTLMQRWTARNGSSLYRRDDNSVWCDLRDEGLDDQRRQQVVRPDLPAGRRQVHGRLAEERLRGRRDHPGGGRMADCERCLRVRPNRPHLGLHYQEVDLRKY